MQPRFIFGAVSLFVLPLSAQAQAPTTGVEGDPNPGSPVEWENNWLSNTFAWASHKLTPTWCQTPEHWTSRIANYLWTDCPCCATFRGITIGLVAGVAMTCLLFSIAWLAVR